MTLIYIKINSGQHTKRLASRPKIKPLYTFKQRVVRIFAHSKLVPTTIHCVSPSANQLIAAKSLHEPPHIGIGGVSLNIVLVEPFGNVNFLLFGDFCYAASISPRVSKPNGVVCAVFVRPSLHPSRLLKVLKV